MCEVVLGSGKISAEILWSSSLVLWEERVRGEVSLIGCYAIWLLSLYSPLEGLFGFAIST